MNNDKDRLNLNASTEPSIITQGDLKAKRDLRYWHPLLYNLFWKANANRRWILIMSIFIGVGIYTTVKAPQDSSTTRRGRGTYMKQSLYNNRLFGLFNSKISPSPFNRSEHLFQDIFLLPVISPIMYQLRLEFVPTTNYFFLEGQVSITFKVIKRTSTVQINANGILMDRPGSYIQIEQRPQNYSPAVVSFKSNDFTHQYTIELSRELNVGETAQLVIPFRVLPIPDHALVVVKFVYAGNKSLGDWFVATTLFPTDARRLFPCLDEPQYKAPFKFTFTRPKNLNVLSTARLLKTVSTQNGSLQDEFDLTHPISPFAFGFLLSPFIAVSNGSIVLWMHPQRKNTPVNVLFGWINQAKEFFDKFFNQTYPLTHMNIIATLHYIGDMQSLGMIYIPDALVFFDVTQSHQSPTEMQRELFVLLCRGLAKDWLLHLVTPEKWEDYWLFSGIGGYLQYHCVGYMSNTQAYYDRIVIEQVIEALNYNQLSGSKAVVTPIDTLAELYDSLSASRAKTAVAFVRMMEYAITPHIFDKTMKSFISKNLYKTVTTMHFLKTLNSTIGFIPSLINFEQFFDSWMKQSGYPVVTLTRNYSSNTAIASQTRYCAGRCLDSTTRWMILLSPAKYSGPDPRNIWLLDHAGQVNNLPSAEEFYLLNDEYSGFYRVNYDKRNWDTLVKQLVRDHNHISTLSRAQLLQDLNEFVRNKLLDYKVLLRALEYLKGESEFIPWRVGFSIVNRLNRQMIRTAAKTPWSQYMLSIWRDAYNTRFALWNETVIPEHKRLRNDLSVLLCDLGYQPCLDEQRKNSKIIQNAPAITKFFRTHVISLKEKLINNCSFDQLPNYIESLHVHLARSSSINFKRSNKFTKTQLKPREQEQIRQYAEEYLKENRLGTYLTNHIGANISSVF